MDEQEQQGIFGFPAQIRAAQMTNRDELLVLAKARSLDPAIFDEHDPFFWAAIISNTRLDSYWTHMARSSLENYARGAQEGVSFQNSHRWNELPLGASLTGRVEELESGLVQVVSDFYTLAGLQLNGLNTDQFILGVRSGVVKDVSIGWSGGTRICDICKQNFMRCPHWPGLIYEVEGADGVRREVRATVTVEDAKLHEVSAVYDGATPGAVILKARAAAADGRLRGKEAEMLEQMYRVALPVTRRFGGVDVGDEPAQNPVHAEQACSASIKEQKAMDVNEILARHKVGEGLEGDARLAALDRRLAELQAAEAKLSTVEADLATAQGRIAALEPQAADGVQYRNDLIAEALAEGVRAKGADKFDQATYEPMLRNPTMTLAAIRKMRDDWAAEGNLRFPGTRRTTDSHEPPADRQNASPGGKREVELAPRHASRA